MKIGVWGHMPPQRWLAPPLVWLTATGYHPPNINFLFKKIKEKKLIFFFVFLFLIEK
jgi:hypothetical protein